MTVRSAHRCPVTDAVEPDGTVAGPEKDGPVLQCEGLASGYGKLEVVADVDLCVRARDVVGIAGRNGSGKSTLLRTLAGFIPCRRGRIALFDEDVTRVGADARSRLGLGLLHYDVQVFEHLTVAENLAMARQLRRKGLQQSPDVHDLVPELGAALTRQANLLSEGERRQLALAILLMSGPRILLLDEPAAGLSEARVRLLASAVLQYCEAVAGAAVIVEHNAAILTRCCTRLLFMSGGRLVREIDPRDPGEMRSIEQLLFASETGEA